MTLTISLCVSAFFLGLFGGVHCIAMCSGLSQAAISPRINQSPIWREEFSFLAGRVASYAGLGLAVAAAGGALSWSSQSFALFRACWILLNALLLVFGVLLLIMGRQPPMVTELAQRIWNLALPYVHGLGGSADGSVLQQSGATRENPVQWLRQRKPEPAVLQTNLARPFLVGAVWGLLPCGLLWSALALAALAPDALAGALVMAAFAVSSSGYLSLAGRLRHRLQRSAIGRFGEGLGARIGGAMLAIAAGAGLWSLATGLPNPLCTPINIG
jgi:sulfite exporter TauE/SafE